MLATCYQHLKNKLCSLVSAIRGNKKASLIEVAKTSIDTSDVETEVSISTILGRRIEEKHFTTDENGKKICSYKSFYDTRVNEDLSLDALGYKGNVEKKIKNDVAAIVNKHNQINSSGFIGWVTIRKKNLQHHKIFHSPDKNPLNPNPYHCSLDRSSYNNTQTARSLAYELMTHANDENNFLYL